MCTVYEDDEKIFEALAAGANGYLLKKSSPLEIIDAIKDVLNGSAPMSGQIARKVVNFFQRKSAITSHDLSARESEILNLLADGFSNKEIAEKLFVSVHTIRNHLYKIYEKLQVHSRVEAVNKLRNFTKL
ncbi:MAG: response regulator transcription factor [Bacteroidetes bacterium]|nr:response regulator transcription factor [Bacteroidota bacterium]MBK8413048.1 response regulator transcription factor [Bacteroidota bacterium]MBK9048578.1 response regulator transcription factor [Bacteroidota bacterium]MBK9423635.1 response regulator transcription factor [Bacteroidota bacterium]